MTIEEMKQLTDALRRTTAFRRGRGAMLRALRPSEGWQRLHSFYKPTQKFRADL